MLDKGKVRTFVLGGIAGAVAGILLAPRSGRELRGSIANRAGEARERGRETYFEAQERARERLAEARDRPPRVPRTDEPGTPEDTGAPGLSPQPSPNLGGAPPVEGPAGPPPLRDVSRGAPGDPAGPPDAPRASDEQEELRRRIRETRSRLRERLDGPGTGGQDG